MWEAYGRRCAYCGRWTEYDAFQIDHIISQAIIDDPLVLKTVADALALPANFDYQGLENLIVSCAPCNNRKSGWKPEARELLYSLNRAKEKVEVIRARKKALWDRAKLAEVETLLDMKKRLIEAITESSPDRDEE